MNAPSRPYRMTARAEAAAATRARIVDAALAQFLERWYDEVTLSDVGRAAGVTQQTVLNHFGSKEGLLEAAVARLGPERHRRARHDDPVAGVVADYEIGGDATVRMIALEERLPALAPFLTTGRAGFRAWIETTFADRLPPSGRAREQAVVQHVAALDVLTWKLLRRDLGLSRAATVAAMRATVDALAPR